MEYKIKALSVGKPVTHILNGKELRTGFIKKRIKEADWLTKTGFKGDEQADLKNHGGEDKALLMYAVEHYDFWKARYQRDFEFPSFGENITIQGLKEDRVCIGDIYELGEAVIQVSQPRQPCYKIAEVHRIKDIPAVVTETGYSGYYFRVLKKGYVSDNDILKLVEKDKDEISVTDIQRVLFHERDDIEGVKKVLRAGAMASSLRRSLESRLSKLTANDF